jgi:hypothetical protein
MVWYVPSETGVFRRHRVEVIRIEALLRIEWVAEEAEAAAGGV